MGRGTSRGAGEWVGRWEGLGLREGQYQSLTLAKHAGGSLQVNTKSRSKAECMLAMTELADIAMGGNEGCFGTVRQSISLEAINLVTPSGIGVFNSHMDSDIPDF